MAVPSHGLRWREPAAQRRLAGRVRRAAGDSSLATRARARPAQRLPDSGQRARHQPGLGTNGGHAGGGRHVRQPRQH